jgi:hypothetical protein
LTPHAFYRGLLKDMRTHLGEPTTFCPNCPTPFPANGDEYCSDRCAEDHDTTQTGGTPLPEHERCTCPGRDYRARTPHYDGCPRYVSRPEDYTHPMENEP